MREKLVRFLGMILFIIGVHCIYSFSGLLEIVGAIIEFLGVAILLKPPLPTK